MLQVAAGADIDTSLGGLDVGEVQLLTWGHAVGETPTSPSSSLLLIPIPALLLSQLLIPITASSPVPSQDLALPPALGTAGQGPPILPGPVVIQGGFPAGLAPQCDRTALWHCRARWVDTDSKQGRRTQWDTGLAPHTGVPCVAWSTPVRDTRGGCRG